MPVPARLSLEGSSDCERNTPPSPSGLDTLRFTASKKPIAITDSWEARGQHLHFRSADQPVLDCPPATLPVERRQRVCAHRSAEIFERHAARYDAWFESPEGRSIFPLECRCLEALLPPRTGKWLEVGVGTGRFAAALGIEFGVDPSPAALRFATERGITSVAGCAEALPFPEATFTCVFLIVTICFVEDPRLTVLESARVLSPGGSLIVGFVPSDSPWGKDYRRKAAEGHAFYSAARFYGLAEVRAIAENAGLLLKRARSTLFFPPDGAEVSEDKEGYWEEAGFVGLEFQRG